MLLLHSRKLAWNFGAGCFFVQASASFANLVVRTRIYHYKAVILLEHASYRIEQREVQICSSNQIREVKSHILNVLTFRKSLFARRHTRKM